MSPSSLMSALDQAFDAVDLFAEVYLPVKIPTASGQPENYTYENIGIMPDEIASIYAELYGSNFLVEDFETPSVAASKLARRIQAVIHMNKSKYLKYIELQGYSWNPMWNVDGTESETYNENGSDNIDETYGKGTSTTVKDDGTVKLDKDTTDTDTATHTGQAFTYTDTTSMDVHGSVTDPSNPSTGQEATREYLPETRQIDDKSTQSDINTLTQKGSDTTTTDTTQVTTSSGEDTKKGSNSHTDSHTLIKERHGNIGVTKTTELIDDARETLKWSILQDFFDDINEQILIGIY